MPRPFLIVIAAFFCFAAAASAYTLAPLRMELRPTGPDATGRLTITNNETVPVTLTLVGLGTEIAADGTVTRVPTDALTVFPPQAIIQPGKEQAVQIRYVGAADAGPALYNVHVSQVPIQLVGEGRAQVAVALDFYSAIVVQPEGLARDLTADGFAMADGQWTAQVTNAGDAITRVNRGQWSAIIDGTERVIGTDAIDAGQTGYVLPGSTRTIALDPAVVPPTADLTALGFTAE